MALLKVAEIAFIAGITKMKRTGNKCVTEGLHIISAMLACFGTEFAFFAAGRGATDMFAVTGRRIDTITMTREMSDRVLLNLARNGRRRFVESVGDIAQRKAFREKRINANTLINSKVF